MKPEITPYSQQIAKQVRLEKPDVYHIDTSVKSILWNTGRARTLKRMLQQIKSSFKTKITQKVIDGVKSLRSRMRTPKMVSPMAQRLVSAAQNGNFNTKLSKTMSGKATVLELKQYKENLLNIQDQLDEAISEFETFDKQVDAKREESKNSVIVQIQKGNQQSYDALLKHFAHDAGRYMQDSAYKTLFNSGINGKDTALPQLYRKALLDKSAKYATEMERLKGELTSLHAQSREEGADVPKISQDIILKKKEITQHKGSFNQVRENAIESALKEVEALVEEKDRDYSAKMYTYKMDVKKSEEVVPEEVELVKNFGITRALKVNINAVLTGDRHKGKVDPKSAALTEFLALNTDWLGSMEDYRSAEELNQLLNFEEARETPKLTPKPRTRTQEGSRSETPDLFQSFALENETPAPVAHSEMPEDSGALISQDHKLVTIPEEKTELFTGDLINVSSFGQPQPQVPVQPQLQPQLQSQLPEQAPMRARDPGQGQGLGLGQPNTNPFINNTASMRARDPGQGQGLGLGQLQPNANPFINNTASSLGYNAFVHGNIYSGAARQAENGALVKTTSPSMFQGRPSQTNSSQFAPLYQPMAGMSSQYAKPVGNSNGYGQPQMHYAVAGLGSPVLVPDSNAAVMQVKPKDAFDSLMDFGSLAQLEGRRRLPPRRRV